jgi:hypothetical protein
MDKDEARLILEQQLNRYRRLSYLELLRLLDEPFSFECAGLSGKIYQIEIEVFWDEWSKRTLRVSAAIDDGGWRSMFPMCADFIMRPDGSFVGE